MARTFKRKNVFHKDLSWYVSKYEKLEGFRLYQWKLFPSNSKEYKKGKAKFHAMQNRRWYRPLHHFVNMYTERPQRREAVREIRKFLSDQNYEVQIREKNKIPYYD